MNKPCIHPGVLHSEAVVGLHIAIVTVFRCTDSLQIHLFLLRQ